MTGIIKILLVEHNPDDIELILEELKTSGLNIITEIVKNRRAYCEAIGRFIPDIILSDFSLPSFHGDEAFQIRGTLAPSTPFLFVSGSIGEERSIEYIRNGVTDYVLKDKLFTLSVKVKRALVETRERLEKKRAEQQLVHNKDLLERAQQLGHMGSWEMSFPENILVLSDEGCRIFGLPLEENRLSLEDWTALVHPNDLPDIVQTIQTARQAAKDSAYSHRIILKDGTIRDIYSESKFEQDENGVITGMYGIMQDVTERKKAAETLQQAYDEKDTVLERIDNGFFAIDKNSAVTYWNKKAEYLLETKKEDVVGKNLHEVFAATESNPFYDRYSRALSENTSAHFVEFYQRTGKWFEVSAFASDNGLSVYFKDVTGKKLAEDQLKESELRYRSIIDQATDLICIAGPALNIIDVNIFGCELLGYSKQEFLQMTYADLFLAEDVASKPFNLEPLSGGKIAHNERRFKTKAGELIDVELSARMLEDGRIIVFGHDVTERKKATNKIKESELRYRSLNEQATDAICITDSNLKFIDINPYGCETFGYSREEALQMSLPDVLFPEDLPSNPLKTDELKSGKTFRNERRLKRKNGTAVDMEVSIRIMDDGRLIMFGHDITERKKTSQEIKWLINNTEESFILLNKNLEITSFNNRAHKLYLKYFGRELKRGTGILDYAQTGRVSTVKEIYERVLQGEEESDEITITAGRDEIKNFALKYKPARDENESIIGAFVSVIDITEKKKAEQQMEFERRDKEALINTTTDLMWSVTSDFKLIAANRAFISSVSEFNGTQLQNGDDLLNKLRFTPDYLAFWRSLYTKTLAGTAHTEEIYFPEAGNRKASWREITFNPIRDGEVLTGIACYSRDTTNAMDFKNKLIDTNNKLQAAQQIAALGYWELNMDMETLYWSDQVYSIWDITPGEIKMDLSNFLNTIHPEDREQFLAAQQRAMTGTEKMNVEHRIILPSGKIKFVQEKGELVYDNKGRALRFEGTVQDITERKELEILLNRANILSRTGSWEVDIELETLYWSPVTKEIHEVSTDFVPDVKTAIDFYKDGESRQLIERALERSVKDGIPFDIELQIVTAKNNDRWIRAIGEAEFKDGVCKKISGSFQDITQRKVSELNLKELNENISRHAKKLAISNAELEQFAYVASHDLQEPLRMITSFLKQLEKKYAPLLDEKGIKYINFAVGGAKRMRQIILDLLEFSRVGVTDENKEDLDINEVITQVQMLLRKKIEDKNATITATLLPVIHAHRSPVHQVFQNLIANALTYGPDNKSALIHISVEESSDLWQFAISDNGIGIKAEYFDKIFIIFQRLHNKDEYSGTGMGLAVTKKIIENMGGKIWVESEPGNGSTFYFTIKK